VFIIVISSITFVVNREPNVPLWKLEKISLDFNDFSETSPRSFMSCQGDLTEFGYYNREFCFIFCFKLNYFKYHC